LQEALDDQAFASLLQSLTHSGDLRVEGQKVIYLA
jgi:hypothetical protein